MHHAWLIRPFIENDKTNYTDKFIHGGYVATGPNRLPDLKKYSSENLKRIITENKLVEGSYRVGALAVVLNNFANKMEENDIALLINGDDIYSLEIIGEYTYTPNTYVSSGFHSHKRKVRFMKHCLRSDLSEEMRLALKSGRQIADITRYYAEVYKLTYGKELEEEKSDAGIVEVAYPLRKDFQVTFSVPGDMTRDEARRLESFFRNLYFEKKQ